MQMRTAKAIVNIVDDYSRRAGEARVGEVLTETGAGTTDTRFDRRDEQAEYYVRQEQFEQFVFPR